MSKWVSLGSNQDVGWAALLQETIRDRSSLAFFSFWATFLAILGTEDLLQSSRPAA